jgi:hypothetical protein
MSTLQQDLDHLGPTPPIRDLATQLHKRTAIESDRQRQYVSLRPSLEGAVAVYLHRTWISVALPPERATHVVSLVPGSTLDTKTPATTYWHVTADAVAGAADTVLDVAHEAVDWRARGPKSSVGAGHAKKAEKKLGSCPDHWLELLPSGKCSECG